MANHYVGIDYGTTKSAIALFPDGGKSGPKLFEIEPGTGNPEYLPSVVRLRRSSETKALDELYAIDGNNGIGHHALFSIVDDESDRHTFEHAKLDIGQQKFSPQRQPSERFQNVLPKDIASLIFRHLKTEVEVKEKTTLLSTTISVPANWNPVQRQATKHAALIAGFEDVALVEEPVAALIYLYKRKEFEAIPDQNVMVIDFGGGTCDIAIIQMLKRQGIYRFFKKKITPKVSRVTGNNALGGQLINQIILDQYPRRIELSSTPAKRSKLLRDIEYLKKRLNTAEMWPLAWDYMRKTEKANESGDSPRLLDSFPEEVKVRLPDDDWSVTAQEFHQWLRDDVRLELANYSNPNGRSVIQAFRDLVSDAVEFAQTHQIDRVCLVGGSSLLYFVKPIVSEILPQLNKEGALIRPTDPANCVALGTAWHEYDRRKGKRIFAPRFFHKLSVEINGDDIQSAINPGLPSLLSAITESFDLDEIEILCLEMGIDEDEFPETRTKKAEGLIKYAERRGRLNELVELCRAKRPHSNWDITKQFLSKSNPPHKINGAYPLGDNPGLRWILQPGIEGFELGEKGFRHIEVPPFTVNIPVKSLTVRVHSNNSQTSLDDSGFVKVLNEAKDKVVDEKHELYTEVKVDIDGIVDVEIKTANRQIKFVESSSFSIDTNSEAFLEQKESSLQRFVDLVRKK